jgi:hypothetical protein
MVERSPDLFDILYQWVTNNYPNNHWTLDKDFGVIGHKDISIWVGGWLDTSLRSFYKNGPDLVCLEYWESEPGAKYLTATDPEFFIKLKDVLDQHMDNWHPHPNRKRRSNEL